jgi:hypothetical protein
MSSTTQSKKLPKEAIEFAKKMGADLSGMEAEAEDMWGMLNTLSERSEYEYSEFIKQQFEAAQAAEKGELADSDKGRFFRPISGLAFETTTIGGDGVKVRILDAKNPQSGGKKIVINLCHHKALEQPRDHRGQVINEDRYMNGGIEIPLAVGPLRELKESSESACDLVVDVVMHESVVAKCKVHNMFLDQVSDIA